MFLLNIKYWVILWADFQFLNIYIQQIFPNYFFFFYLDSIFVCFCTIRSFENENLILDILKSYNKIIGYIYW